MDWVTPLNRDVDLVRPLLGTSREEIMEWITRWGIDPSEDVTNRDGRYLRNRVRHEVLPVMRERLNPEVARHLAAFSEQQRKLESWVASEARERGKSCMVDDELHLEPWRFLPEVLRERVLMGWLQDQGADMPSVRHTHVTNLMEAFAEPVTVSYTHLTLPTTPYV